MEALEKDLLAILEADSRIPAARLAAMLGVSEEQVKA
ncbi:MAG: AsnC family protein, partial [Clostridia bacterium]|nr:AsnC family protein [Clostridia bacterium]